MTLLKLYRELSYALSHTYFDEMSDAYEKMERIEKVCSHFTYDVYYEIGLCGCCEGWQIGIGLTDRSHQITSEEYTAEREAKSLKTLELMATVPWTAHTTPWMGGE